MKLVELGIRDIAFNLYIGILDQFRQIKTMSEEVSMEINTKDKLIYVKESGLSQKILSYQSFNLKVFDMMCSERGKFHDCPTCIIVENVEIKYSIKPGFFRNKGYKVPAVKFLICNDIDGVASFDYPDVFDRKLFASDLSPEDGCNDYLDNYFGTLHIFEELESVSLAYVFPKDVRDMPKEVLEFYKRDYS